MEKDIVKRIEDLMDLFDEGEVTTADEIERPENPFRDFNERNPMAGGGMLVQPSADGSRPGYAKDEKKAACRISIKAGFSYGWCSGSLINNTANNCTPYVLTADHCAFGQSSYASANDHNQWIFYFNYR